MAAYRPASDQSRHVALSVVVPVYQCAGALMELHQRLTAVLSALVESYEIVFVDDRSNDDAWGLLKKLAERDPCLVAIRLSRNFGQQLAITAGLEQCCGDHAVVMDCDLQDPPEAIPALHTRAREGYDIVLARRKGRYQSSFRAAANRLYVAVLGLLCGRAFDGSLGAFSIISRRVVEALLQFPERGRHYLLILLEIGYDTAVIEYQRDCRRNGGSSFGLSQLLAHAMSGLLFATNRLLYWTLYIGLALLGFGLLSACVLLAEYMATGALTGWTAVLVVQILLAGVVVLSIGVNGIYLGKVLQETQRRPLYFVQERLDGRAIAQARGGDERERGHEGHG